MNVKIQTLRLLGLGSLLALALGITSTALRAVPTQPLPNRVATTVAAGDSNATAMACTACRTISVTQRGSLQGTKAGTALFTVGTTHECAMCGGQISRVGGNMTETMQQNCPICGKSHPSCCEAASAGNSG